MTGAKDDVDVVGDIMGDGDSDAAEEPLDSANPYDEKEKRAAFARAIDARLRSTSGVDDAE